MKTYVSCLNGTLLLNHPSKRSFVDYLWLVTGMLVHFKVEIVNVLYRVFCKHARSLNFESFLKSVFKDTSEGFDIHLVAFRVALSVVETQIPSHSLLNRVRLLSLSIRAGLVTNRYTLLSTYKSIGLFEVLSAAFSILFVKRLVYSHVIWSSPCAIVSYLRRWHL